MTEPKLRTAAIDAAIGNLNAELGRRVDERRKLVQDVNSSPEQLAKLNSEIQALRDKIEGQQETRREAAKLDARDKFLRERAEIKAKGAAVIAALKKERVAAARRLDEACALMGEALHEIDALNRSLWPEFVGVTRSLGLEKKASDNVIDWNQSRIMNAGAAITALVHALKNAGLGSKGILQPGCDVFADLRTFPTWSAWNAGTPVTIAEAMTQAAERAETDLARLIARAEREVEAPN